MYMLVLTHGCTVNISWGLTQIWVPNARAGQRVATGQLEHVQAIQKKYSECGYGTRIVEMRDNQV